MNSLNRAIGFVKDGVGNAFLKLIVALQCALPAFVAVAADDLSQYQQFKPPDKSNTTAQAGTFADFGVRVIVAIVETAEMVRVVGILMGVVVVTLSLYSLYRASKDERERPAGAIVGLFVGGALISVPTFVIMMYNTLIAPGTTTPNP